MRLIYLPLEQVVKLAFDTAPIIYFIERNPTYIDRMRVILRHISHPHNTLGHASVMVLAEVLVQPLKMGNYSLAQKYERILAKNNRLQLIPVSPSIARQTAKIRADYGLKTPDALHIATAIETGCDAFLTNDRGLQRVTEIKVLVLDDMRVNPSDIKMT